MVDNKLELDLENFVRLCHLHEKVHNLEQALAEKDREITHLQDVYTKQRHKQEDAYQQLMEKAIRFSERLAAMDKGSEVRWNDVEEFLNSPEVQAWKKEQT